MFITDALLSVSATLERKKFTAALKTDWKSNSQEPPQRHLTAFAASGADTAAPWRLISLGHSCRRSRRLDWITGDGCDVNLIKAQDTGWLSSIWASTTKPITHLHKCLSRSQTFGPQVFIKINTTCHHQFQPKLCCSMQLDAEGCKSTKKFATHYKI